MLEDKAFLELLAIVGIASITALRICDVISIFVAVLKLERTDEFSREAAKLAVNSLCNALDSVDKPITFDGCLEAYTSIDEVDLDTLSSSLLELNKGACNGIADENMTELAL